MTTSEIAAEIQRLSDEIRNIQNSPDSSSPSSVESIQSLVQTIIELTKELDARLVNVPPALGQLVMSPDVHPIINSLQYNGQMMIPGAHNGTNMAPSVGTEGYVNGYPKEVKPGSVEQAYIDVDSGSALPYTSQDYVTASIFNRWR